MTGRDVAELLGAELRGESRAIARLSDAATASADAVIVVGSAADLERAGDRDAALVVGPPDLPYGPRPHVTVDHPRLALALLAERFDRRPVTTGIAHAAHIDPTAELGPGAAVGPGAVVEAGARIGAGSVVGPGAIVGPGAVLGEGCRLHANATLYDGVMLGDRVVVHAGAVIGADGFGYAASASGARKIRHLGIVKIGDDVEIGANTCIDRATLDATRIGPRTKIDNLCQIGHNVSIGADCLIAGMTGIGGSAKIGDRVTIAGYVGVADHVTIGDGATIGARSGVHKDVPAGETWIGAPAKPYRAFARSLYLQGKLDEIWQFVKDRR